MEEGYRGGLSRGIKTARTASKQNSSIGLGNIHTGVVAGVGCAATDTSFFCTLSKFSSAFYQGIAILFIIYALYITAWPILKLRFKPLKN